MNNLLYTLPITQNGKTSANGIEIYYESFGNPQNPAILLIMGLDAQCTLWSMSFIEPLVEAGYYVIRFDNRDIGLSTWINDWSRARPYTLEDMAKDAIGLLDALAIQKTHVIGASMGGMIAQRLAISYPDRIMSLTSIMSSGHSFNIGVQATLAGKLQALLVPWAIRNFDIKSKYTHFEVTVGNYVKVWRTLAGSKYPFNEAYFKELFKYNILERKGQNPRARVQQLSAIIASGSRLAELGKVKAPTLVLHGTEDQLVPPAHAQLYAPKIPHAKVVWLEGVGHEIPHAIIPQVHQEVLAMINN
ncbi:MAG: alpha/beta fold hydrolase [Microscillaceae bacterium]|nr:alpha/beta fold hydrolase [Microscillaceae bacterium]